MYAISRSCCCLSPTWTTYDSCDIAIINTLFLGSIAALICLQFYYPDLRWAHIGTASGCVLIGLELGWAHFTYGSESSVSEEPATNESLETVAENNQVAPSDSIAAKKMIEPHPQTLLENYNNSKNQFCAMIACDTSWKDDRLVGAATRAMQAAKDFSLFFLHYFLTEENRAIFIKNHLNGLLRHTDIHNVKAVNTVMLSNLTNPQKFFGFLAVYTYIRGMARCQGFQQIPPEENAAFYQSGTWNNTCRQLYNEIWDAIDNETDGTLADIWWGPDVNQASFTYPSDDVMRKLLTPV